MSRRAALGLIPAALCAAALAAGFSAASFTDGSQNPQTVAAVPDFLAPSATASAIAKAEGGVAGHVKKSGTYYVYAQVAESGNPPSGVASVKADVSAVTPGQTAVALVAGSYAVGGASYNYRSAQLTAGATLAAGAKTYSLALTDAAGNSRLQNFSVTVDNGPFGGADFATDNGARNREGEAEPGDSVAFTYGTAPDPASVVPGWDGSGSRSVAVSIADSSKSDLLTVAGAAIGSVALQGDYVDSGKSTTFAGSTLTLSGSSLTIVLGGDADGNARRDKGKNAPEWTPSESVYDAAGNACSPAKVTGANQRQF